ncbi:MAG: MBL fold metallo-hydrolase [Acidobacteriota bacterium]|nr:MBL fold metallo-hydrolase [Acidobacteriota bacterium]
MLLTDSDHRHPRRLVLAAVCLSLVAFPAVAQDVDWDAVSITSQDVGGGIHVLFGRGGNIGLSTGKDGALLVDDQYAPLTDKILAAVRSITDEPVRFVVNTHWHGDHTGGNENLGKAGSLIVAHENVRRRMNPAEFADLVGRSDQAAPEALPVVTFERGVTLHWNGLAIEAVHAPAAHTDGDSIIFFRGANVVHMGDLFFNGAFPFIDVDSGGGIDGMITAAGRVVEATDDQTTIIPGHGPVTDRATLMKYRDALRMARERISGRVAAGQSEDDAAADYVALVTGIGTDIGWAPDAGGFVNAERFVRLVHRSLSSQ